MDEEAIIGMFLEDDTIASYATVATTMGTISIVTDFVFDKALRNVNIDVTSTGSNVRNFLETIDQLSDREYKEHFRMERTTMQKLIDYLKEKINNVPKLDRMIVPFEKKVLLTLWLLSNKDSYREAASLFGIHKSTVSYVFHEICEYIADCRCDLIKWPTREEQDATKIFILSRKKFPNCLGFIDGCHIQILAPANNPVDCYNRKETHSILLQAVCDESLKFIDIYLGHTGRAHDARVFRESPLGDQLPNLISNDDHILGDSAYTLSLGVLTPYRDNGHLSQAQKNYNKVHATTRAYIERAFGLLKGKFRRLKYLELHTLDDIPIIVCAVCVLHNFIILNENIVESEEQIEVNLDFEGLTASQKRDIICEYINTYEDENDF